MFAAMRDFSTEVSTYTEVISRGDVKDVMKLTTQLKDVWHCLKLTGLMKQLAQGAGRFRSMQQKCGGIPKGLFFGQRHGPFRHEIEGYRNAGRRHERGLVVQQYSGTTRR